MKPTHLLATLLSFFIPASFSAAVTHVDAVGGAGGNTVNHATGSPTDWFVVSTGQSPKEDGLWGERSTYGIGGTQIYENWHSNGGVSAGGDDSSPQLRVTIPGLTTGTLYHIWVDYMRFGSNSSYPEGTRGGITAGLSLDNLYSFDVVTGERLVLGGSELNGFASDDRVGVRGYLGVAEADGSGEIHVFVDPYLRPNVSSERTWLDGVSYEEVSGSYCENPPPYDLTGDCIVDARDLMLWEKDWLQMGEYITPPLPGEAYTVINDNGAWCWFEDERAIIHNGKLIIGSVADVSGTDGATRNGNIELATYDFATGEVDRFVLHGNLQADDHDSPAFLVRPDGRYLTMYSRHGSDSLVRYRISTNPNDATEWQGEQTLDVGAGTTYSNIFRLSVENGGNGRIYNFHRALNWDPTVMVSDDNGETWSLGGKLLTRDGARPYVRYASNNTDVIHFITTDGHPRDINNSIYHGYVKNGKVYNSAGVEIDDNVYDGNGHDPADYTQVFPGDADNVAWTTDIHLDEHDYPYIAFSVQKDQNDQDHRYYYGRWDGAGWHVYEMAYAGSCLYDPENDYTGLVALTPGDPNTVYISADVNPVTGSPLISTADGKRHYEIFKGVTTDGGAGWTWSPITENSTVDNIRPIVPYSDGVHSALLWLAGTYSSYTNFDLDVVGLMTPSHECLSPPMDFSGNCVVDLADFAMFAGHWLECGLSPKDDCP